MYGPDWRENPFFFKCVPLSRDGFQIVQSCAIFLWYFRDELKQSMQDEFAIKSRDLEAETALRIQVNIHMLQ